MIDPIDIGVSLWLFTHTERAALAVHCAEDGLEWSAVHYASLLSSEDASEAAIAWEVTPMQAGTAIVNSDEREPSLGFSYLEYLILGDLAGVRSGKCACHIAATIGIAEKTLYPAIIELLSFSLIRVADPSCLPVRVRELVKRAEAVSSTTRRDPDASKQAWWDLLRYVGESTKIEVSIPLYFKITSEGYANLRTSLKNRF